MAARKKTGNSTIVALENKALAPKSWQTVCEVIEDPFFLHDEAYRLLLANQAYLREAGMTQEEALGKLYWEVFPRGTGPLPGCKHAHEKKDLSGSRDEINVGEKTFISRGYNVKDNKDCSLYSLHILSDITEQKKTEKKLGTLSQMYRTISNCNQILVRAQDEGELARKTCRTLVEEGVFSSAWIGYAQTNENQRILPIASAGVSRDFLESLNLSWAETGNGHDFLAPVINRGDVVIYNNFDKEKENRPFWEKLLKHGYTTLAAFPLRINDHTVGVFCVFEKMPYEFTEEVKKLLIELAGDLSFGISNLRAQAERYGILEKLEHTLDHAVSAIAATVEMRDPYTAGHQRKVARLSGAIAEEMGLPEDRREGLRMAGVVHDIGKIHVPAEILSNPGKLTAAEFEIIKTHSQAGYDILKGIDFPWPVAEIVWQHHERLDGSGYPRGLKGESILMEARILAVADVIESMSSHRPYRPGFGIFTSLQEVSRNKGRLFDTKVVEACLRLFMEKGFEFGEYHVHFPPHTGEGAS